MKKIVTIFPKVLKILTAVGLFGLVLGSFITPLHQANAEVVMVTGSIVASPGTICVGESSHISWATTDATSIVIQPGIGSVSAYGERDVSPTQTTTYTMTLSNSTGGYGQTSATVYVNNSGSCQPPTPLPTVTISASPSTVPYNSSSTITWTSNNATSCTASGGTNGWAGSKNLSGTFYTGALTNTTTYYITCTNSSGSASDSTTVTVIPQTQNPTVTITANPSSIPYNGSSTVTWSSANATSCTASGGTNGWAGSKNLSGNFYTGNLTNGVTYNIICTNSTGSANALTTVAVGSNNTCTDPSALNYGGTLPCQYTQTQNPTVTIYANPSSVSYNGSSTLTWSSSNATYCTASGSSGDGWAGSKNLSGNFYTGNLTYTTTYNITCTNSTGGTAYASATVSVGGTYQQSTSVTITADRTNIAYNEGTTIRWYPINATACSGSAGSNGWAGTRSAFSDIFYTGPLSYTTTYTISCSNYGGYILNGSGSDSRSVTVYVGNQNPIINPSSTLDAITTPATGVTSSGAQLNGLIQNSSTSGYNSTVNAWFEWGSTTGLGNKTPTTNVGNLSSVRHASFLTGLVSGRTYYFRAVAENSTERNVGSTLSFATTGGGQPIINQSSLVLISSSVDRNQPIIPTIDNSKPHPGDEINYTVNYQNVGNASISSLSLRIILPFEVDYISSNPNNPNVSSNVLTFNLGTLRANGQGIVTVRVRVRDNIPAGTNLNFPATLSYVNPSGQTQSVNANVSAQVWSADTTTNNTNIFSSLGANVFGAGGFLPSNIFGWLLLIVLILILIFLARYLFGYNLPFITKKTTTTTTTSH